MDQLNYTDQTKSMLARAKKFREDHPEIKSIEEFLEWRKEWLRNNPESDLTAAFWEYVKMVDYSQGKSEPSKEDADKDKKEAERKKRETKEREEAERKKRETERKRLQYLSKDEENRGEKEVGQQESPQQNPQMPNVNQIRQSFNRKGQRSFFTRPVRNIFNRGLGRSINGINNLASNLRVLGNAGRLGSLFGGGGAAAGAGGAAAAGAGGAAAAGGAATAGAAGAGAGGAAAAGGLVAGGWIVVIVIAVILIIVILITVLSGVNNNSSQQSPQPTPTSPPGQISNDLDYKIPFRDTSINVLNIGWVKQQILSEFPNAQLQYWDNIVNQSISHGWNPAFVLTLWIEETGASAHTATRNGGGGSSPISKGHLGCAPNEDQTIDESLSCLFKMRDINNGGSEFSSGRFEGFMRQYSGETPTGPFRTNADFPSRVKRYYSTLVPSGPGAITVGVSGNFVYYCQGNTAWKSRCNLGLAGCAPTSLAMILSSLGANMDPTQVDDVFQQRGWRSCGDYGSSLRTALLDNWLRDLGFRIGPNIVSGSSLDLNQASMFLAEGSYVVASSHSFPCANCKSVSRRVDHAFVVDGVSISSQTVSIRDANNCSYTDGNDENKSRINMSVNSFPWDYAYPIRKL